MDRFDMENELTNLNKISDDLKTIAYQLADGSLDKDDLFAALYGLSILHDARYAIAWDTFLQVFKLDEYSDLHNEDDNTDSINDCHACDRYIKDVLSKYDYPDEDKTVWY